MRGHNPPDLTKPKTKTKKETKVNEPKRKATVKRRQSRF